MRLIMATPLFETTRSDGGLIYQQILLDNSHFRNCSYLLVKKVLSVDENKKKWYNLLYNSQTISVIGKKIYDSVKSTMKK